MNNLKPNVIIDVNLRQYYRVLIVSHIYNFILMTSWLFCESITYLHSTVAKRFRPCKVFLLSYTVISSIVLFYGPCMLFSCYENVCRLFNKFNCQSPVDFVEGRHVYTEQFLSEQIMWS